MPDLLLTPGAVGGSLDYWRAVNLQRLYTAIHEAGHAVCGIVSDSDAGVVLYNDPPVWRGLRVAGRCNYASEPADVFTSAVCSLAGGAAANLAGFYPATPSPGDYMAIDAGVDIEAAGIAAKCLLASHWRVVAAVAGNLAEFGQLSAEQVGEIADAARAWPQSGLDMPSDFLAIRDEPLDLLAAARAAVADGKLGGG